MSTFSAITTLPVESAAVSLCEALEKMEPTPSGVGVFELEDGSGLWEVGAYFLTQPNSAILELFSCAFGAKPFIVSELPEIDWVAHVRRELAPVSAGRFFVYGSHDFDKLPADKIGLQIEATVAFGTGHHGTTLGCLRAFDRLCTEGFRPGSVVDIGCGTAVLAIGAAAVLPDALVIASDIDKVAVDVALANVGINNLSARVSCFEAAGFDHPRIRQAAPYDLVFVNILKGTLIDLAPDVAACLAEGGIAILSGLLGVQANDVQDAYIKAGHELVRRDDIGEWSTLVVRRCLVD